MRIGIDIRAAGRSAPAASEIAFLECLLKGLLAIDSGNEYHVFSDRNDAALRAFAARPNVKVANPFSIPLYAALHRLDVLQCARYVPLLRPRTVVFVPDVSHEFHGRDFAAPELKRLAHTRRSCRRAKLVFAASEFCRRQLKAACGVPLEKIVVTPEAADHLSGQAGFSRTPASLGLPERYVVFSGGMRLRDNLPRMLTAFDQLLARVRVPHYLVIPVRKGETAEGFEYALRLMKHRSRVLVFRNLSEADLYVALRAAEVFACPSLYDGPGISPLVAQRLELPCLVSAADSHPETYGDSVLYCDPVDPASIASGLERLLGDPLLRSGLAQRGTLRSRGYSWTHTAAIALEAYQRLAAAPADARPAPAAMEA